jgi:hypothetical protein
MWHELSLDIATSLLLEERSTKKKNKKKELQVGRQPEAMKSWSRVLAQTGSGMRSEATQRVRLYLTLNDACQL